MTPSPRPVSAVDKDQADDDFEYGGDESMKDVFKRLCKEEEGQDLTEYGLLIVFVALALVTGMSKLASGISSMFTAASTSLS